VKANHPRGSLLLRIRTDDRGARCPLGVKYGALMNEVENLLLVADHLGVPVAGIYDLLQQISTFSLSISSIFCR
jgi:ornithine decarboxylase